MKKAQLIHLYISIRSFVKKFRDKGPVSCYLSWVVTSRVILVVSISISQILDRWDDLTPVCIPAVIG